MEFNNAIVGGSNELVRTAIQSRGFVSGSVGWRIKRDGNAEFNDVTIRGGLVVTGNAESANYVAGTTGWRLRSDGTAEFNGTVVVNAGELHVRKASDELIIGDPAFANPAITAYKNGVVDPGTIIGFRPLGTGVVGWQISSANTVGHDRAVMQIDEFGWRVQKGTLPWLGMDFATAGINTVRNDGATTYLPYVVDGKVYTAALVDTNAAGAAFVTVTSANAVNVPTVAGRAYRATVRCRVAGSVLNDRVQLIVANGTTQVGQDFLHRITGAITTFQDVEFSVIWNEFTGGTIANLNLRVARFSGTGTVTVRVESSNYFMVVEEIGDPALISGL